MTDISESERARVEYCAPWFVICLDANAEVVGLRYFREKEEAETYVCELCEGQHASDVEIAVSDLDDIIVGQAVYTTN